jgi:DNA modification methylase
VGFKPCAWPLVWCKTSPCHNQAPQYNATKSTEVALVLRKGNYTLPKPIVNNFLLAKNEKNASHPFFKPIQVWEWLILNFTKKGDVVLDPFAGEGSCILTLLLNQRVPIGFEIDPNHFNTAVTSLPALYEKELSNRKTISDFFD